MTAKKRKRSIQKQPSSESNEDTKNKSKLSRLSLLLRDWISPIEDTLGFKFEDLVSLEKLTILMHKPTDPSSLGVVRILFGMLMMVDILEERGLTDADLKWGNENQCTFPLFNFLQPLPLEWMCMLYFLMWIGAFGIMLGAWFKISCLMFLVSYWYLFLLDKSTWNNHSYLYGLLSIMFFFSSANYYWSLDGVFGRAPRDAHVPLWNYAILRFQNFVLYFIAGLKKFDLDWISGYSMSELSNHWVFSPFTLLLTEEQVDFWIVHIFGFLLDLTIGFWIYFDKTRPFAFVFLAAFHLMNSRLFHIGMFPYVCLASMPLFCHPDWARNFFHKIKKEKCEPKLPMVNSSCIYTNNLKNEDPGSKQYKGKLHVKWYQKLTSVILICHVLMQGFLPYSHFLTKGYNNWTNGLYGYSWDMMVHTWDQILIVVNVVDKNTGEEHFLDPEAWVYTERWSKHADMVKQYAHCLQRNIQQKHPNLNNISVHIDVWCSLNRRFQQRMFDPRVDLLTAEWSPFQPVSWLMPLLTEFSPWRSKISQLEQQVYSWSNYSDALFVADFPGLYLENYIHEDLTNISLTLLEGQVTVELEGSVNRSLSPGQSMSIPSKKFHKVHTISATPSCYMYTYINQTRMNSELHSAESPGQVAEKSNGNEFLGEIWQRWDNFLRAIALVSNAILKILYNVPMIKRVRIQ